MSKSIVPLLVGIAIVASAIALTVWNERRTASASNLRSIILSDAVSVDSDQSPAAFAGKLVRVVGEAGAKGEVQDPATDLSLPMLRLDRIVETAQWQENKIITHGGRDLTYELVWSPTRINSNRFQDGGRAHPNLPLRLESESFLPAAPHVGAWRADFATWQSLVASRLDDVPAKLMAKRVGALTKSGGWWWSANSERPRSGDVRLRYAAVPVGPLTVIGRVANGVITAPVDRDGAPLPLSAVGDQSAAAIVGEVAASGAWQTWQARSVALAILLLGSCILLSGVRKLAPAAVSRLGGVPAAGVLTGATLWLLATGLAWLAVRIG